MLHVNLNPDSDTLNPAGQALVGSHILYKWPRIGWQQGELVKWNDNPKCKNGKKVLLVAMAPSLIAIPSLIANR
jgi:hypothetical protein